jgi:hypothetical protein
MAIGIKSNNVELKVESFLQSFDKRTELLAQLLQSATEVSIKYCEGLSENDLGGDYIEWKDRDEIVSVFLDTQMFSKWAEMVAIDLGRYAVQIPD